MQKICDFGTSSALGDLGLPWGLLSAQEANPRPEGDEDGVANPSSTGDVSQEVSDSWLPCLPIVERVALG